MNTYSTSYWRSRVHSEVLPSTCSVTITTLTVTVTITDVGEFRHNVRIRIKVVLSTEAKLELTRMDVSER